MNSNGIELKITKENSAVRDTHAGRIFSEGAKAEKTRVLASLPRELAALHESAVIHIHDLDGWCDVGNCSTPLVGSYLRPDEVRSRSSYGRVADLFAQVQSMVGTVCHRQTGGIGIGNFDVDMAEAMRMAGVEACEDTAVALREEATRLFARISTERLRNACENFYLTINLGLDTTELGRMVTRECISAFESLPPDYTRPNIVFKVKRGVNAESGSPNYDLFLLACGCTAKKMIPTYLLMDSAPNVQCDPLRLNIMGCRTRVYANRNGECGTPGRGNIAAVSVNLPHIAMETREVESFTKRLDEVMSACRRVLLLRADALRRSRYVGEVVGSGAWAAKSPDDMCRQGTYSIGFIGLAEAVEILGRGKLHEDDAAMDFACGVLGRMRDAAVRFGDDAGLNFALLASPGEGISGRFASEDQKAFPHDECWRKGYYTNSFHVPVDAGVSIAKKLQIEGPMHRYATGGSISYVELREAPVGNEEAIADIVSMATDLGVSYLGINFPLDYCNDCRTPGTFDTCPRCGSGSIKRIRRVSGYLETLDEFATGKRAEEANRRANG